MVEIKGLNKQRIISCLWGETQNTKLSVLSEATHKFKAVPIKIPKYF